MTLGQKFMHCPLITKYYNASFHHRQCKRDKSSPTMMHRRPLIPNATTQIIILLIFFMNWSDFYMDFELINMTVITFTICYFSNTLMSVLFWDYPLNLQNIYQEIHCTCAHRTCVFIFYILFSICYINELKVR